MALGVAFVAAGMAILCLNSGYCDSIWSCTFHVLLIWKYILHSVYMCRTFVPMPPTCMQVKSTYILTPMLYGFLIREMLTWVQTSVSKRPQMVLSALSPSPALECASASQLLHRSRVATSLSAVWYVLCPVALTRTEGYIPLWSCYLHATGLLWLCS